MSAGQYTAETRELAGPRMTGQRRTMAKSPIEILHVGSAARDMTADDPRGWRLGGGTSYAALTTARLGIRTAAVVGADAAAASATELDLLRSAGVDVLVVPLAESPVFVNDETPEGRIQTCVAPGRPLPAVELPRSWMDALAWSIVPVAAEVGDRWASAMPPGVIVSVGWQGWLRILTAGATVQRRAPASSPLLRRANLVGVSRHDLAPGTQAADLARLLRPGADLLVTEGVLGGRLWPVRRDGVGDPIQYPAIASDGEVDPTGAGDTFLAALLASLVRPSLLPGGRTDPAARLDFAAAAASLVIEDIGLLGVPDLTAVHTRHARRSRPSGGPPS